MARFKSKKEEVIEEVTAVTEEPVVETENPIVEEQPKVEDIKTEEVEVVKVKEDKAQSLADFLF